MVVVNGHTYKYLRVLAVQHSLTVVPSSQAFRDAICEYRVMSAIFLTVVRKGYSENEAGSRRGIIDTRRRRLTISAWFP